MDIVMPRGKIIQKRVQKKERYARMVRIRQRKQQQISLATIKPLEPVFPLIKSEVPPGKHQLPMGFYIGDKDGKLDVDMSLINKSYTTNCIDVYQDVDKILSVNLNKKNAGMTKNAVNTDFLEDWEQRDTPYWKMWTSRLKNFTSSYNEFIEKNKYRFKSNKPDKQQDQKYDEYVEKCREIMKYKPCTEVVKSFNADSFSFSKINYNSKMISCLHYEFNEFIDMILKRGIQKLRHSKVENGGMFGMMMDNFSTIFERPVDVPAREAIFVLKSGELQRTTANIMISGHFVKNAAEVSFFVSLDVHNSIPISLSCLNPCLMHIAQNILTDEDRRQFFEKYYPILYMQFISDCRINTQKRQNSKLYIEDEFAVKSEDYATTSNSDGADPSYT